MLSCGTQVIHKKMKLFVQLMQGKVYPKPLSFHCLQFYASYVRASFQEIVLFKKCELSAWKIVSSHQHHMKYLSAPHLDT